MFRNFFFTEIKLSLKQPMIYVFLGVITLLVFAATASDNVHIGGSVGNVLKNAPHVISVYSGILSIFGLMIATAFFNNAALRDYQYNFNEILFSTPLSKAAFYFGRFSGALLLSTIPLLGVFLGIVLGAYIAPAAGWLDADRIGDFYFQSFINNYLLFILPNMFIAGSVIFAIANKWKNTVISFTGTLLIIMAYIISGTLMSDIDNETLAAFLDVFGIRTYSLVAKYFTNVEKNTVVTGFHGILFWNRLLWIGVGIVVLMTSYFSFSFREKNKKGIEKDEKKMSSRHFPLPSLHPSFDFSYRLLQFESFFKLNFQSIVKNVTFKILFIFSVIILFANLVGGFEYFGLKSYPVSYKMMDLITGSVNLYIIIILVFFSGELVWRDRSRRINEIIDSTPHESIISLIAKALSLLTISSLLYLFFVFVAIIYQLVHSYTRIELDVYLSHFFITIFPLFFTWSGVMIMIQVLSGNKYVGYFLSILVVFVSNLIFLIAGIESNMVKIGGGPSTLYSDMNAFGPGLTGAIWFDIYWMLFSIIALWIAGFLWNRGIDTAIKQRLLRIKRQVNRKQFTAFGMVLLLWVLVASFVYYNTQILNPYYTSKEEEKRRAEYEKKYKKYEKSALPKIIDVKYNMDIFPKQRDVQVKALWVLKNTTKQIIDSLHFTCDQEWEVNIHIPHSQLVMKDKDLGYRIYLLQKPMNPGDTMRIEIETKFLTEGFKNGHYNTSIVENGTFLNNLDVLPYPGYNPRYELSEKNIRKKYNLKKKKRMPALTKNCVDACQKNYLTLGISDFIPVETVISTSGDQIAIAPGSLKKSWSQNGRNYFHYQTDHISQNFYSFISARYKVAKRKLDSIDLEVYYDGKHSVNIERMLEAEARALTYYIKHFGPYYHKQCRIVEFPRYATFAQAFPGTMPYSESFGFIVNLENEEDNNVIDAVIAHEIAHQWWAHQVMGANMQGSTMLSESFAEYSSLMCMKSIRKMPMKMRKFLKYDHDRYLRGRGSETEKELPLYKVENQGYLHYGKGSLVLYALQDYVGEENLNSVLKNFLEKYRYKANPYPTSLDFLKYLEPQVPDSMRYLIRDWFMDITLYDNRLRKATYSKTEDGKFQITLDLETKKIHADSIGNETQMTLADWIDVGFFKDKDEKELMFEKRIRFTQDKSKLHFTLDTLPAKAAIDPRHLLIDRVYQDNCVSLTEE
jgi:hypothetical protein